MLNFDSEKCVNCLICEQVCSFKFTNSIHPSVAAIRIGREKGRWGTPFVMVCDLCKELGRPKCIEICPVEALSLSRGVVVWDSEKCTRCEECVDACPQKAVAFDTITDHINICDLCGGKPLCVDWCPEKAISL